MTTVLLRPHPQRRTLSDGGSSDKSPGYRERSSHTRRVRRHEGWRTGEPDGGPGDGEIGIPLGAHRPKQITQEMVARSARVITMGCGVDADACPARFLVTGDRGLDDPAGQPIEKVREIRDQVRRKVHALLAEIATTTPDTKKGTE